MTDSPTTHARDLAPLVEALALRLDGSDPYSNSTIESFLGAMALVVAHLDPSETPTWGLLGDLLIAAAEYE